MNDYQTLINWGSGLGLSVMGWFARQLWDAVKQLQRDMADMENDLAKNYVPKADFTAFTYEIRAMFQRISDKLDTKTDKNNN